MFILLDEGTLIINAKDIKKVVEKMVGIGSYIYLYGEDEPINSETPACDIYKLIKKYRK